MMNALKFKTLIEQLQHAKLCGDTWVERVPNEISAAFFDNPLSESLMEQTTLLLHALFDDNLYHEVEWFLYEWDSDADVALRTITYPDGKAVIINNVADFCDYLLAEGYLT